MFGNVSFLYLCLSSPCLSVSQSLKVMFIKGVYVSNFLTPHIFTCRWQFWCSMRDTECILSSEGDFTTRLHSYHWQLIRAASYQFVQFLTTCWLDPLVLAFAPSPQIFQLGFQFPPISALTSEINSTCPACSLITLPL